MIKHKKDLRLPSFAGPFSRPFTVESARDKKAAVAVEADEGERAALAAFLGVPAVLALTAKFEVTPLSRGRFEVAGEVKARVMQTCVVSLEDFETGIAEPVEAIYAPTADEPAPKAKGRVVTDVSMSENDDPPDPIIHGRVDLGALATEFVALALDPYPRKPAAAFEAAPTAGDAAAEVSPFAALAKLKPGRSDPA